MQKAESSAALRNDNYDEALRNDKQENRVLCGATLNGLPLTQVRKNLTVFKNFTNTKAPQVPFSI